MNLQVDIAEVPDETKDNENLESEFFPPWHPVPVTPLPVSKLSQGQRPFPPWHPVQKACFGRLSFV